MKTKTVYICEVCGGEYSKPELALDCEKDHRECQQYLKGQTQWGQEFIKQVGTPAYKTALELLKESDNQVEIFETDELGEQVWAIGPIEDTDFWLNTFPTKKEAEEFCKEMDWYIISFLPL